MFQRLRKILVCSIFFLFNQTSFTKTIQEAAQLGVTTSPEVLRAVKLCHAHKQALKGAYGGFLPNVNANAGIGYQRSKNLNTNAAPGGKRTLIRREIGIEARQMIFDGLATPNEIDRNEKRMLATAWLVSGEANDAALRVAEAYLNVLRGRSLMEAARENLTIHERTDNMITLRSESGVSRVTDSVQSRGRVAQAKSNLQSERGALNTNEVAYYRVVGERPGKLIKPKLSAHHLPKSEEEAIRLAIGNSPRLKSADFDIKEALAQHRASHSPILPRLDAVFSAARNRDVDGVVGTNEDYRAMLSANWNLFRGGADIARSRETAYYVQEATEIRNRVYQEVIQNVRYAWVAYKNNERLIQDYKKYTDAARATIDAYGKQFQLGQRTLLDLLNSENEYFLARRLYINTLYDYEISKYRLLNSMGFLLDCLNVNTESFGLQSTDLSRIMEYPKLSPIQDYSRKQPFAMKKPMGSGKKYRKTIATTGQTPAADPCNKNSFYQKTKVAKINKTSKQTHESPQSYTIQLMASIHEDAVKAFMSEYNLSQKSGYLIRKNRQGLYVLTFGNYNSYKSATQGIVALPQYLTLYQPWARSQQELVDNIG